MQHKHHAHHHVALVLLAVLGIGAVSGALTGSLGGYMISGVEALRGEDARTRMQSRRLERLERRKRSRVTRTYPTNASTISGVAVEGRTDVRLHVGSISFRRLNIQAPLHKPNLSMWNSRNWRGLEDQMQYGLKRGVVAYPHSPSPGQPGRMIIAGHSSAPDLSTIGTQYEDIFAVLPHAELGDAVDIQDAQGNTFTYTVTDSREIPASKTEILLQDKSKSEAVLFTCFPIGTTRNRWAVTLELVQ